ncbi:prepilin-type N-terminal cleavage/methylation domain-containing protein [Plesiomonas shigelloides]|uniref:type IV pilus modification PilV family protein n=1 Tax=Plesiomonas shigelloides TaxID=703 RepID=UPI00351D85FF
MVISHSRGFGLIEVLVAMLVIAITVPALFVLQKKIFNRYNESVDVMTAYSIANDELEHLSAIRALTEFNKISQSEQQVDINGSRFWVSRSQPTDVVLDTANYPSSGGSGTTTVVVRGKSVKVQVFRCQQVDVSDKCSASNRKQLATLSRIIAPLDEGYITQ